MTQRKYDHDEIIRLKSEGLSYSKIAQTVGCNKRLVGRILHNAGLTDPKYAAANRKKISWEEAARLYQEGQTGVQIAERFGVTPTAIYFALKKHGIAVEHGSKRIRLGGNAITTGQIRLRMPAEMANLIAVEAERLEITRWRYIREAIEQRFKRDGVSYKNPHSKSKGWKQ